MKRRERKKERKGKTKHGVKECFNKWKCCSIILFNQQNIVNEQKRKQFESGFGVNTLCLQSSNNYSRYTAGRLCQINN